MICFRGVFVIYLLIFMYLKVVTILFVCLFVSVGKILKSFECLFFRFLNCNFADRLIE